MTDTESVLSSRQPDNLYLKGNYWAYLIQSPDMLEGDGKRRGDFLFLPEQLLDVKELWAGYLACGQRIYIQNGHILDYEKGPFKTWLIERGAKAMSPEEERTHPVKIASIKLTEADFG